MVIDFHAHIFPENVAKKALDKVGSHDAIVAYTDGTVGGLINSMKKNDIDYSVVLPVVTNPNHAKSVNEYSASLNNRDGIIAFGGLHPQNEDYKEILQNIKSKGLKGIKLHPQFQNCRADDDRYVQIVKYAISLGLIITFHSGMDFSMPNLDLGMVEYMSSLLDKVGSDNISDSKIIFAHLGGWDEWDKVEKYLCGRNVYFDTSYTIWRCGKEQFSRVVKKHGFDKILFGTDSPWSEQGDAVRELLDIGFTQEENDSILHKNALKLLF